MTLHIDNPVKFAKKPWKNRIAGLFQRGHSDTKNHEFKSIVSASETKWGWLEQRAYE